MERLEIFEGAAGVLQLHVDLAELAHQQAGQVGDGKVGKQVDEDHDLERLQLGMRAGIRGDDQVVIKFEDGAEEDESESGAEISPGPRQQHAGDNDDQGVEEIQRTVDAAGYVDDQRDHGQIGEHLQHGLQAVFVPDRNQKKEKQREHEPQHHTGEKRHDGQGAGSEADDGKFDGQQDHQDQDANLHQPGQPVPLIGDGVHEVRSLVVRRSLFAIRLGEKRTANDEQRIANGVSFSIPPVLRSSRTAACTEK